MSKHNRGDCENTLPRRFADRHLLYQWSVQVPKFEVQFMDRVFRKLRGRKPLHLREDFCGTGLLCCEWVRRRKGGRALGLDLDQETLAWGREHNVAPLGNLAGRVALQHGDVRNITNPPADLVCAYNFSWFLMHPLQELTEYFRKVRASLAPDGLLFLDCYGGWEAQQQTSEPRLVETPDGMFTYTWEQADYNPIDNVARCYIHFELAGGRTLRKAFTYEWRVYTPAEARDALLAAGFSDCVVYWDFSLDPEVDLYRPARRGENQPGWLAYIVGVV
ncbi:MAG: class I SAM-dependent methyltransferase [Candidatus Krumholzibacteria bacterium]|jgi:SAM-dependent methyltransferase|nr:class I SAM-dependent methyltransferase [Candidatus Krumholzibacteria bacterium]